MNHSIQTLKGNLSYALAHASCLNDFLLGTESSHMPPIGEDSLWDCRKSEEAYKRYSLENLALYLSIVDSVIKKHFSTYHSDILQGAVKELLCARLAFASGHSLSHLESAANSINAALVHSGLKEQIDKDLGGGIKQMVELMESICQNWLKSLTSV